MHSGDIWRTFLALSGLAISTSPGFHSFLCSAATRVRTRISLGGNVYALVLEGHLFPSSLRSLMGSRGSGVLATSHDGVPLGMCLEVEEKETSPDIVPWVVSSPTRKYT